MYLANNLKRGVQVLAVGYRSAKVVFPKIGRSDFPQPFTIDKWRLLTPKQRDEQVAQNQRNKKREKLNHSLAIKKWGDG